MSFDLQAVIDSLKSNFPDTILDIKTFRNETTLLIKKEKIQEFCMYLKNNFDFKFIVDITAVDYLERKTPRYEVVYYLHRFGQEYSENVRIRLKVEVPEEDTRVLSVRPVWSGANWLEPEDYDAHPLRKDFDVRNREPSKRCFEKALKEGESGTS